MRKEIFIKETIGLDRRAEYVEFSVPCRKGELSPTDALMLVDRNGVRHPVQTRILAQWHDDSIKWLHVVSCIGVPAHADISCFFETCDTEIPPLPAQIQIEKTGNGFKVDTGPTVFTIPEDIFAPFSAVQLGDDRVLCQVTGQCRLLDKDGAELLPHITAIDWEEEGPLRATIRITGAFLSLDNARFSSRIQFFAGTGHVKISFTLHNPRAAMHLGGLWDLGEEAACLFKGLFFKFQQPVSEGMEVCFSVSPDTPFARRPAELEWSIYQESSGGENWRSPAHRNRLGIVPMKQCGFVVEENGREVSTGRRATPIVWTGCEKTGIALCLPLFWQEFPKGIEVKNGEMTISLFTSRYPDLHELQPGERKTNVLHLDFSSNQQGLAWAASPLEVTLSEQSYSESGLFIDLPGREDLVDRFTSAEQLLEKREIIDEYGWRNFGDVFADHEAVYHQGKQPFISHYNNQYDLIAGAYRKFFSTGDPLWRRFAADMAQHVIDIDIYHTDGDREEYNHGLFWHTEHYSDAELSTHRSHSREHKKTYELYAGGGGPGAEHCYTTGLMLHYFQTGNPDFRQEVLDLAGWELLALSGPQTVLAAIKRAVDNLKLLRAHSGENKLFPCYPLTRGTGNAITTCLDAYEVSNDNYWIDAIENLIKRTLHPDDDIQSRDLLNAEICWSYTVLLAAVAKYLDKKLQIEQCDDSFHHARKSLLAYAGWMAEHEYPFLDKPEILEFPNETWVTQDLRKSVVFFQSARYADTREQAALFMNKAKFFYQYAENELPHHASSRFTRPITLMLQNGWVGKQLQQEVALLPLEDKAQEISGCPVPYLSIWTILKRFVWDFGRVLHHTNLHRELAWLKARFNFPDTMSK